MRSNFCCRIGLVERLLPLPALRVLKVVRSFKSTTLPTRDALCPGAMSSSSPLRRLGLAPLMCRGESDKESPSRRRFRCREVRPVRLRPADDVLRGVGGFAGLPGYLPGDRDCCKRLSASSVSADVCDDGGVVCDGGGEVRGGFIATTVHLLSSESEMH